MSELPRNQPQVLPTLAANLNLAISDVIHCFNAGLIFEAWRALETLYAILPPKVYRAVQLKHDSIKKEFEATNIDGIAYEDLVVSHNNGMAVLNEQSKPFFREMYERLYKGGYLEKLSTRLNKDSFQSLEKQPE